MTDQAKKTADLIDRYIAAVEHRLPAKGAKDIVAELRAAIGDKIEALEAGRGRTANKDEVAAIIKSFGSPMLAAARYTGAQHLIGPDVYPYYWPVVRIVVGIVAAVAIVGFIVQGVVSDDPLYILRGLGAAWTGSLFAFGIVTAIFVAMDRAGAGARIEAAWTPHQLPANTREKPKGRLETLFALAWQAVFIAWWIGVFPLPNMMPPAEPGITVHFDAAAWSLAYAPVLVLSVAQAVLFAADLIHPAWSRVRAIASIALNLGGLGVVWMLAQAQTQYGQLIIIQGNAGSSASRVSALNDTFGVVSQVTLYGLAIGFAIAVAIESWRLMRSLQAGDERSPVAAGKGVS
jgi:hypothetical protein